MEYKYFDAHSHLTEAKFDDVRAHIVADMKDQRIGTISIGVDYEQSVAAVEFALEHNHIFAAIGQHPYDNRDEVFSAEKYRELLVRGGKKIVCIGECGLDYYWASKDLADGKMNQEEFESEKVRQKNLFEQHIDFAAESELPLMLHVRSFKNGDAHVDVLQILDSKQEQYDKILRANFHFFTETPAIAKLVTDKGYYISFPGVVTFAKLDESIMAVPLDKILTETDSPYAAPKPYRGQYATPLHVPIVVKKIAEARGISEDELTAAIRNNIKTLFGI